MDKNKIETKNENKSSNNNVINKIANSNIIGKVMNNNVVNIAISNIKPVVTGILWYLLFFWDNNFVSYFNTKIN